MSDNKKYYYLKIKENFYDTEDIKLLQSMDNGYLYSDILMKLYLKSLKNDGKLMFKDHIPYNAKMIATITSHNVDVVKKSIDIFNELGLIEILDNGAMYMAEIQNFIGESSSEGDRKREFRKKIDIEKQKLLTNGQMSDIRPPELEKELEKDKYIDIYNYYLSLDIVKHLTFTPAMLKAIKLAITQNNYSVEDCKELLRKHKEVIVKSKSSQYPIKKRPLVEFFGQKIKDSTALICTQYETGGKYDYLIDEVKVSDPNRIRITKRDM